MIYALIWQENCDLIADFDSQHDAADALREFVAAHPSVRGQVRLIAIDGRTPGHRAAAQ